MHEGGRRWPCVPCTDTVFKAAVLHAAMPGLPCAPSPPQDARLTPSGQPEGTTAVIAYAGRFLPRLPLQRSVPVLLKVRHAAGRSAGQR